MIPGSAPAHRALPISEHHADCLTHGIGFLLAIAGAPVLVSLAARSSGPLAITASAVYAASLITLFAASTCYHTFKGCRGDHHRLLADHIAIYVLIAGTYTAVALTALRGPWGWTLFGLAWGLAAAGTALKLTTGFRYARISMALYLMMGWLAIIAVRPILQRCPTPAIAFLVAGGLCYTLGTLFYARVGPCRIPYSHAVWHTAVVAGSALHFFAVRECLLSIAD
jgi:hemolysin III